MREKQRPIVAVIVSVLGYFFLAAMGACSKLISSETSIWTMLFFQNWVSLFCISLIVMKKRISSLRTQRLGLHFARTIGGLGCFYLFFQSLEFIPLINGMVLLNTAPLWVPFVVWIWLKIRIPGHLWWGILVGFIGVIVILRPGIAPFSLGYVFALGSGIFLGSALVVVSRLSHTEPTHRIIFYYAFLGTLFMAPAGFAIPSSHDFFLLIGVGIFMFLNQFFITYGFQHGKASFLAPTVYTAVAFSGLFDWLIWDHIPDLLSTLGILIVIAGALISIHFELRYRKRIEGAK